MEKRPWIFYPINHDCSRAHSLHASESGLIGPQLHPWILPIGPSTFSDAMSPFPRPKVPDGE